MKCNCYMCKTNDSIIIPQEIIDAALAEELVLFCGAGISTENKGVLPYTFYTTIKDEMGIEDNNISFSELMQKYCKKPNGRRKLILNLKKRFDYIKSFPILEGMASRFHKELSTMFPIKTIITTNWDTYFEDYCDATPIVSPKDFALYDKDRRHLFKIHGSINNLSSLVATTDDYDKCYEKLTKGVLGAHVKAYLSSKTVVFIGFSFGDEDFERIMRYISDEMEEYYPHFYVVSIDEKLKDRIGYDNCTCITADGTYFLHQLRLKLINSGYLYDCEKIKNISHRIRQYAEILHLTLSQIDIIQYPCVIYTLAYQDGFLDAFGRFGEGNRSGEYCAATIMKETVENYKKIITEADAKGSHASVAYFAGYLHGLWTIYTNEDGQRQVGKDDFESIKKDLNLLYLPDNDKIKTLKTYFKHLQRLTDTENEYKQYALYEIDRIAEKNGCIDLKGMTYQFFPWY